MRKCFKHGQRIRHVIGGDKTWIGIYVFGQNKISYSGTLYSLNKFASSHYKVECPYRVSSVNAWKECECEVDGKWISTYSLPG